MADNSERRVDPYSRLMLMVFQQCILEGSFENDVKKIVIHEWSDFHKNYFSKNKKSVTSTLF